MAGFGYFPQSAFYPVQTTMQSYAPTYDFATALKIQSSNNSNQAFQGIIHSHVCMHFFFSLSLKLTFNDFTRIDLYNSSSIFNEFKTKISSDTVEKLINKIPTYPPMIFKYIFHGGDMIQIT